MRTDLVGIGFGTAMRWAGQVGWLVAWMLGTAVEGQAGAWKDLFDGKSLAGWKVTDFAGKGEVEVAHGAIVLNQGVLTGVNWTGTMPKVDYEVALDARRVLGSDFFCGLTFPVNDTFCTLIVGGWGGGVVGLSSLDGEDAAHNETTKYMRFETGKWYDVRLRVARERISVWLDNEKLIDAEIKGRRVAMRPGDIELSAPFGLASWSTTAELRKIRMRTLDGTEDRADVAAPAALPESIQNALDRLVGAATNSRAAHARLSELCDRFGPRFSGSTNLEAAIDWILGEMRKDGLDEVRGEAVAVPRWVRGEESVEMVAPRWERLSFLGLGGSVATPEGGITAPVLVVKSMEELKQRGDEAKGKIVVFEVPYTEYGVTVGVRVRGAVEAARVGAVASLIRSVTPFSMRTPHTGMMLYDENVPKIPHGALAPEDSAKLLRWQERGEKVALRLKMSARTEGEAMSRNVIGEIRGREKPDEVVVIGGHIDSWDVGQGAQDDGGGCVAAWEALRLMKQLGLRPRRTVRCVLWTNEENGSRGARAYRDMHARELDQHVAAMESDNGIAQVLGFSFTGSDAGAGWMKLVAEFLGQRVGAGQMTRGGADADVGPLLERGVPVLGLRVDRGQYFWYHHTEADTPDKVDPRQLADATAVMAAVAYSLAEFEVRLPR